MAKSYTASIDVRCRKEHTCVGCGAVYSYQMVRKVSGTGGTAAAAQANLQKAIPVTLERETDLRPCPTCGLYQPDMIGPRRASKIKLIFWLSLVALAVLLILLATDVMQHPTVTWATAVVCGIAALAQIRIDLNNQNKDLQTNLQLGIQHVTAMEVQHTPGQPTQLSQALANPPRTGLHTGALLFLAASVVLVIAPEILRSMRHWPLNNECYPPVVGPGDSTRFYMKDSITSVKSYWRGSPLVTLKAAGSKKAVKLNATTNENSWGNSISAKSSEKSSTSHPWVIFTLPPDANLANKEADTDIVLSLDYPQMAGSSSFEEIHSDMNANLKLQLAGVGDGGKYVALWWQGTGAGIAMLLGASLFLLTRAKGMRRVENPARIYNA